MNVRFSGDSTVQFPTTPGLVHVNVLPPAGPETDNVPLHDPPVARFVIVMVKVPEKEFAVVVPPTVPFLEVSPPFVCQAPLTVAPLCVSVIVTG